jgi:nicotinamidase-related amidase
MIERDSDQKEMERLRLLVEPPHCALLIQEMQEGVVGSESGLPALARAAAEVGLVGIVAKVARAARRAHTPVIHCTAENLQSGFGRNRNARLFAVAKRAEMANEPGTDSVQPVSEIGPAPGDFVLPRYHGLSPMCGSPLDQLLRNSGITTVVVVGVSLNIAIANLVFDAVNRSYQVIVVSDGVVGVPIEFGNQILANTLSLISTIVDSDQLLAAWAAPEPKEQGWRNLVGAPIPGEVRLPENVQRQG